MDNVQSQGEDGSGKIGIYIYMYIYNIICMMVCKGGSGFWLTMENMEIRL